MPITVNHVFTNNVPDVVGTVTVFDAASPGSTNTVAATNLVRPSDWNSGHLVTYAPTGQEIIGAFSNGGNVTFGTNLAGYITATAPAGGGAGDGGNVIAAGGSTANSTGTIVFGNANNVSFGLNAGTVTASASYAAQTVDTNKAGTGFTSTTTGGTAVVATLNTNGLSMGIPLYQTAAGAGDGNNVLGVNGNATSASTTYILSNANNVSFGLNAGTITASASFAGGAADGVNVIGINGQATSLTTTYIWSNANNVTFGYNAGTVTASASYAAQTVDTNKAGTGFTSTTTAGTAIVGTLNTNGLSIGVPTIVTNALTTAAQSNHSHNFATTTTNGSLIVVATTNSNGATIAVPSYITTFTQPGATVFSNSNNVSFGLNGSTVTATATFAQTNQTGNFYVSGNTTQLSSTAGLDLRSISFEGAGIASVGVSNGRVLVSVPSGGGAGDGVNIIQAGTTGTTGTTWSSISATVQINGSGGILVSQNNSNQIVISDALFSNVAMTNLGFTTATNGLSINNTDDHLKGWSLVGNTAGTNASTYTTTGPLYLSGGNNVTLSGNSNTIVISAAAGGGAAATLSTYVNMLPASTSSQTIGALNVTSASAWFFPFIVSNNVAFNCMAVLQSFNLSTSATAAVGGQTISQSFGIYSNNAGTLSAISTNSHSIAATLNSVSGTVSYATGTATTGYGYNTTTYTTTTQGHALVGSGALRDINFQFGNTMSLAPGIYWLGMMHRMSSSGFNVGLSYGIAGNAMLPINSVVGFGQISSANTTNSTPRFPYHGMGVYTSTGSAGYGGTQLPTSAFVSGIAQTVSVMPFIELLST